MGAGERESVLGRARTRCDGGRILGFRSALLLVVLALSAGCGALNATGGGEKGTSRDLSADAGIRGYYNQRLDWAPCVDIDEDGFECAFLRVPIDYSRPG